MSIREFEKSANARLTGCPKVERKYKLKILDAQTKQEFEIKVHPWTTVLELKQEITKYSGYSVKE